MSRSFPLSLYLSHSIIMTIMTLGIVPTIGPGTVTGTVSIGLFDAPPPRFTEAIPTNRPTNLQYRGRNLLLRVGYSGCREDEGVSIEGIAFLWRSLIDRDGLTTSSSSRPTNPTAWDDRMSSWTPRQPSDQGVGLLATLAPKPSSLEEGRGAAVVLPRV